MEPILSRRERERQMRRDAILRAAEAVFAERGYTNATLDEIAQRAEFGKGTLYNYFEGGKEAILIALFDEIYDGFIAHISRSFNDDAIHSTAFRETFHTFLLTSFTYFAERQNLFLILIKEAYRMIFGDHEEKAAYFLGQRERLIGALAEPLERAMQNGDIQPMSATSLAHIILGNINNWEMKMMVADRHHPCGDGQVHTPEEGAAMLTTMFFDGLLAHPEPVLATP